MADTIRTQAAILALLADNTNGDISPQDLRDMMLSLQPVMGQVSMHESASETAIAVDDTWYEMDMTGAALDITSSIINATNDFDMPAAGRLRYLGSVDRMFHCVATLSFVAASNNQEIHIALAKNGVPSVQAELHRKVGTGADVGAVALHWIVAMSMNDYLSIFVKNVTSAANMTATVANLQTVGMLDS